MVMEVAYIFNNNCEQNAETHTQAGKLFADAMNKCNREVQKKYFQWRFGGVETEMTAYKTCGTDEMSELIKRLIKGECGFTLAPQNSDGVHTALITNPHHHIKCDEFIKGMEDYDYRR